MTKKRLKYVVNCNILGSFWFRGTIQVHNIVITKQWEGIFENMNILYCGDRNIADGLVISVLSLMRHVEEPLNIYILTTRYVTEGRVYEPLTPEFVAQLEWHMKQKDSRHTVSMFDISQIFAQQPPIANINTRFTPCCMLRLYADKIMQLPDKILYLDNDVVCRQNCGAFYHQDISAYELAGVPDYYGKWFFHNRSLRMDYLNSGVLLLNLGKIRETGLFAKCRERCATKKMFMPDQSAINKLAVSKKVDGRSYNEQRKLQGDTVFQHFTTSFRFFPWIHTVSVKPWQIDKMHQVLKLYEYDEVLEEYSRLRQEIIA